MGSKSKSLNTLGISNLVDDSGNAIETLQDAGYTNGDFLPVYTFQSYSNTTGDFTTTTYANDESFFKARVVYDTMFPLSEVTPMARIIGQVTVGTDETVNFRVQNTTDGETVKESINLTTDQTEIYTVEYTPTTTNNVVELLFEWKEDTGTNPSQLQHPVLVLGVKV